MVPRGAARSPPFFGEVGIDPRAEPGLVLPPPETLVEEDLVDAAPLDRDAFLLVEVGLQAIERPAAEGQIQALRIGQGRGDDLSSLLGGVGVRTTGPRLILQTAEPLLVEAMEPGVDRRARDAQILGHLAGSPTVGEGQKDPGPLDEAGLSRPRDGQLFEGQTFLGGRLAERDFGEGHGCISLRLKTTPVLRQTAGVSSLAGCTT